MSFCLCFLWTVLRWPNWSVVLGYFGHFKTPFFNEQLQRQLFYAEIDFFDFFDFSEFGKSRKNSTKRNLKMHITIQYLLSFWFFSGIPKSLSFWLPLGMQLVLETSGDFRTWLRKMEAVNVWKQFKLFSHARVDFMNCFAP